jgi:hypothetical protein
MKKTSTLPNKTIHIIPEYNVELDPNKMMSLMKPSIFANYNNDTEFPNYTY